MDELEPIDPKVAAQELKDEFSKKHKTNEQPPRSKDHIRDLLISPFAMIPGVIILVISCQEGIKDNLVMFIIGIVLSYGWFFYLVRDLVGIGNYILSILIKFGFVVLMALCVAYLGWFGIIIVIFVMASLGSSGRRRR